MKRNATTLAAILLAVAVHAVGAQPTDARRSPSLVRVHVVDSTGAPVEGAELSLMRGLKQVIASARSDAAGEHQFMVDLDSTDYSVVARKVGYTRGDRFIAVDRTAVDARVVVKQLKNSLPTVTVTAVDLKRKSYHLDADDIANSPTYVGDGLDIVRFVRPDMATSRSGSWNGRLTGGCPPLETIWINGRRYPGGFVIVDPIVRTRLRTVGRGVQMMGSGNATILAELAPEHIAEMNYVDCFEPNKIKAVGGINALFVTLKPGVDFRLGWGTFVTGDTTVVASGRK